MKSLKDYLPEAEQWIDNPVKGDSFDIELAPDHLIESYVVETTDDGIVINGDSRMIELLESYGHTAETIRRYGPVGSNRGVGFTVAEGEDRVDSLVTKGLGLMRGPKWLDAVAAIKYQVGERDYRERKEFYDFFVQQLVDRYGKKGVAEIIDYDTLNQLGSHPMAAPLAAAGGAAIGGAIGGGIKKTVDYFQKKKEQKAQARRSQQQGVAEGELDENRMAEIEMMHQDWKKLSPAEFFRMYKITKQSWHDKYKNLLPQESAPVEEDTMGRMLELAGMSRTPVEETAPYQPEQNAAKTDPLAAKAADLAPVGAIGTEIDEATSNSIDFQGRMVDRASIELDDVHSWDYPDFSDAYISYATYTDGTPLSDTELDQFTDQYGDLVHELAYDSLHEGTMDEAKYQGREVPLGKPMAGDVKKSKVYVRDPATGNIKKVNFGHGGTSAKRAGQKTMKIKKSNPARRKSFRARHNCDNPGPRTKARYWSCRAW